MQRTARLAVLGIALVAGLAAAFLVARTPPPPEPVVEAPAPRIVENAVEVLTAASDLEIGSVVRPENLAWRKWPADSGSPHLIRRDANPRALEELVNSIVRVSMIDGEPIRPEK